MTRSGVWLLRWVGLVAAVGLVVAIADSVRAMRAGAWLAIPDLAMLELTVVVALGVATASSFAVGRDAFELEAWTSMDWIERLAILWCTSLAALLGAFPGLALGLGPPAVWPVGLIGLATGSIRAIGSQSPRRIAWLLCTSYGLAALASLVLVRRIF